MNEIQKQIETLEANGQLDSADTMEKMLAVVEAAKKTLPYTNGHFGHRAKLVTALDALVLEERE